VSANCGGEGVNVAVTVVAAVTVTAQVLVPELNLGQLLKLVRAEFLVDAVGYNQVRGQPFRSDELAAAMEAMA